jgi:putative endonuclease
MKPLRELWPFSRLLPRRKKPLGQRGEDLAAKRIRRGGLKILARNYRCPAGEADIIALQKPAAPADGEGTIVFVEVKTRAGEQAVLAESAVDARKRRQIANVARYYLSHHADGQFSARFDVVAVIIPPQGKPQVRHIADAFQP